VRSSRCKFGGVWGGEGIGIVGRDSGEGWWNEVDRVLYGNAIMGGLGYCV